MIDGLFILFPKELQSACPPVSSPRARTRSQMPSACRFRPCIDLHQGKVKQIVGSSLSDDPNKGPITNFEAEGSSADFAAMYAKDRLLGGHVIKLGPNNEEAALAALRAYPGGLQIGGGVTPANALSYLEAGASHVIVTSYVFSEGRLDAARLAEVVKVVGRERLVLDLSCRRREPGGPFFVVTDRWQKFTDLEVSEATLRELSAHCVEFLVHAVDVEGKQSGIEEDLVKALGQCRRRLKSKPAPARPPVPPTAWRLQRPRAARTHRRRVEGGGRRAASAAVAPQEAHCAPAHTVAIRPASNDQVEPHTRHLCGRRAQHGGLRAHRQAGWRQGGRYHRQRARHLRRRPPVPDRGRVGCGAGGGRPAAACRLPIPHARWGARVARSGRGGGGASRPVRIEAARLVLRVAALPRMQHEVVSAGHTAAAPPLSLALSGPPSIQLRWDERYTPLHCAPQSQPVLLGRYGITASH